MKNAIEIKGLTKIFGELKAVDNVTLSIKEGELFGFLGPNGSGKTTTVKMLTGQIKPTKGNATILGKDILRSPIEIREIVGIMPEQENPPSFLTAEEYLHFVAKIRKLGVEKIMTKPFSLIELVEYMRIYSGQVDNIIKLS